MTTPTTAFDAEQVTCAGRATVYALLAYGLAPPGGRNWEIVQDTLLPAASSLLLPGPLPVLVAQAAAAAPARSSELAPAHLHLFPPVTNQDAPGYETAYRGEDLFRQMDLLADVAGFYRAHGVRVGGAERERPDHIMVELEFCSVLSRKELHALQELGPDQVQICRETLRAFLSDHLACWAPAFGRRAAAVATHPWYRILGELTALWVEAETEALGLTPVEQADDPLPQEPPDDGTCGPCPVGVGT